MTPFDLIVVHAMWWRGCVLVATLGPFAFLPGYRA